MYIFEAGMQPVSRFETTHYHTISDGYLYMHLQVKLKPVG